MELNILPRWRCLGWLLTLVLLTGCKASGTSQASLKKREPRLAQRKLEKTSDSSESSDSSTGIARLSTKAVATGSESTESDEEITDSILQAAAASPDDSPRSLDQLDTKPELSGGGRRTRLEIPADLPGADADPIELSANDKKRTEEIEQIFGSLPHVDGARVKKAADGRRYTLNELQALAIVSNPILVQADAQIMATKGSAVQAGLHPNPVLGYEADTVGSGGTPNYHGGFVNTVIKTPGKLDLAESVANGDVWNAELAKKKSHIELITMVRGAYFATMIARENVKITEALVAFTDSVYRNQVEQLKGGLVSASEPVQLRALAVLARTALAQARNRHDAAWRQLVATIGVPDLPTGYLEGVSDIPMESIDYDSAMAYIVTNHTDIAAAHNSEIQARTKVQLEELNVTPDLIMYMAVQKDYTTGPVYRATYNMQIGVPVPIFDRNQGNIVNAQANVIKTAHEAARVRNDLANRLADAIERYENARNLTELYRQHILPDQARAFRGIYERHQQQPDVVGFVDVVNAQQTLLNSINIYISNLSLRWGALTEIGALLQVETLDGIKAVLETGLPFPTNGLDTDERYELPPSPTTPKSAVKPE